MKKTITLFLLFFCLISVLAQNKLEEVGRRNGYVTYIAEDMSNPSTAILQLMNTSSYALMNDEDLDRVMFTIELIGRNTHDLGQLTVDITRTEDGTIKCYVQGRMNKLDFWGNPENFTSKIEGLNPSGVKAYGKNLVATFKKEMDRITCIAPLGPTSRPISVLTQSFY